MKCLVTGGSGFVGRHLIRNLLSSGHQVLNIDPIMSNIKAAGYEERNQPFECATHLPIGIERVYHFAALADVRREYENLDRQFETNLLLTKKVLDYCLAACVKQVVFASSAAVYSQWITHPKEDDAGPSESLYGNLKLASELLLSSYAHGYGIHAKAFRFCGLLGEGYHHGHLWDWYRALQRDPNELRILGNGEQRKPYLHAADAMRAVDILCDVWSSPFKAWNISTSRSVRIDKVSEVVEVFLDELLRMGGLREHPRVVFGEGRRGWLGDHPSLHPECAEPYARGWEPRWSTEGAQRATVRWISEVLGPIL